MARLGEDVRRLHELFFDHVRVDPEVDRRVGVAEAGRDDVDRHTGQEERRCVVTPHSAHGGLLLIDPRGMRGEVDYDAAVAALELATHVQSATVAERLAREMGIDAERTQAWVRVADAARV